MSMTRRVNVDVTRRMNVDVKRSENADTTMRCDQRGGSVFSNILSASPTTYYSILIPNDDVAVLRFTACTNCAAHSNIWAERPCCHGTPGGRWEWSV